jgi:UDP-N-acetylmuramoyl-tripeptide--D-alanyl-D-alanine ligase
MLSISHILKALKSPVQTVEADIPVYGGCIDSRCCEDGSLFIALKGEFTDGHLYVDDAFNKGAYIAIIDHAIESDFPVIDITQPDAVIPTEAPYSLLVPDALLALQTIATYWREQFDIPVIGITGSVGKSSSKDLIASVLSHRMRTLKNPGNYNNEIGLPLTLLSLTKEHEIAVLEMGFYVAGEIKLLCDIAHPNIGVLTNIGTVHAERAGSIEAIASGKAELLEELPEAPKGLAILNYDDDFVRQMASKTRARVFYYGLDPRADLWADEIESQGLNGIRCRLHHQGESYYLTAPLIGRHSVFTILRACAVALNLGISWDWIFHAFKSSREQVRVVTVTTPSGALIIDDTYNASPDSTLAALNLLNDIDGRKVAVLGDMLELGQYEHEGHRRVGLRASEVADEIVLIGQRSQITRDAVLETGFDREKLHWFADTDDAINYLKPNLTQGDIVLVKSSHSMHLEVIVSALEETH